VCLVHPAHLGHLAHPAHREAAPTCPCVESLTIAVFLSCSCLKNKEPSSRPVCTVLLPKVKWSKQGIHIVLCQMLMGSHSFTCHPHVYPQVERTILPLLPSRRASLQFSWYSFSVPCRVEGWVGLGGWLTEAVCQGFMTHSTQNRSFWRCSSLPVYWLGTEEIKPNTNT